MFENDGLTFCIFLLGKAILGRTKGSIRFSISKKLERSPQCCRTRCPFERSWVTTKTKQGSVQLAPLPRDGLSRHVGMTKVRRGKIRPRRMKRANFTKQPNVPASTTALHFYSNKLTLDESDTYVWEPTIQARTGRNGNIKASTKQRPLISIGQNEWKRSKYWDKGKRRTSTAYSSKKDYSIAAQESTNPKMIFKRTFRNFTISDHLLGILIAIFMHDGPFLILRLVLLIYFDVRSQIHLFFACKNATNLALMTYRLSHLLFSECKDEVEDENDQSFKLRNVQRAVMGTETLKSVQENHLYHRYRTTTTITTTTTTTTNPLSSNKARNFCYIFVSSQMKKVCFAMYLAHFVYIVSINLKKYITNCLP